MRTLTATLLLTALAAHAFAHAQCGGPPTTVITDQLSPYMPPAPDPVAEHVERHVGPIRHVLRDLSDTDHPVDLYLVAPDGERKHWTLVTSGMSGTPMGPDGVRMELVMRLPARTEFDPEFQLDKRRYWPALQLKRLARGPAERDSEFRIGTVVTIHDDDEPLIADTDFDGVLLARPRAFAPAFASFDDGEGDVLLASVVPLYGAELALAEREGVRTLERKLRERKIDDVVDLDRRNAAGKKNREVRKGRKKDFSRR